MNETLEKLSATDPGERVLLLSHCLRPSQSCPGKFDRKGLICPPDCEQDCVIGRLKEAAISLGYKGVCIAAGGAMAVRFVAEQDPRGIVAVACHKELVEGVEAVESMARSGDKEAPVIATIPLSKDGCVDTEVNEELALEAISVGCQARRKG